LGFACGSWWYVGLTTGSFIDIYRFELEICTDFGAENVPVWFREFPEKNQYI
jgi:hypothetical protein